MEYPLYCDGEQVESSDGYEQYEGESYDHAEGGTPENQIETLPTTTHEPANPTGSLFYDKDYSKN